jgi:iron complex transport system ATP-binding protein
MEIMVYLPQEEMPPVFLTVFEITLLGKLPTLGWKVMESDINKVYRTLRGLHIESLAERYVGEISGGQKKLVSIAQTLVRDPKVILMDEPTNSLDMQKQIELFDIIHQIIQVKDITFIIVLHDLNLSCQHAEQLTIMNGNGGVYSNGNPVDIVTEEMLKTVYGVEADVIYDKNGKPIVTPVRSVQNTRYFT